MDRQMMPVVTISLARTDEEEVLLKDSLSELCRLATSIYISDGGSKESFIHFLEGHSNVRLSKEIKGLWKQAKRSLEEAYELGLDFVFYTEPDKQEFFQNWLLKHFHSVTLNDKMGICLLSRSTKAFQSFPFFQQMTESTINNCIAEITGKQVDYTYGPFFIHREIIPALMDLPDDIGWGWRPYAFIKAFQMGYTIDHFEGDFLCPEDQRHQNESIHRMKQLMQNINGITMAVTGQ